MSATRLSAAAVTDVHRQTARSLIRRHALHALWNSWKLSLERSIVNGGSEETVARALAEMEWLEAELYVLNKVTVTALPSPDSRLGGEG